MKRQTTDTVGSLKFFWMRRVDCFFFSFLVSIAPHGRRSALNRFFGSSRKELQCTLTGASIRVDHFVKTVFFFKRFAPNGAMHSLASYEEPSPTSTNVDNRVVHMGCMMVNRAHFFIFGKALATLLEYQMLSFCFTDAP